MPGRARREQIVEAAHAVILEKGLAEASARDVARRLGVGSGLIHHYFKTWTSLRAEVVRVFALKEIKALESDLAETPADRLAARLVDWMVQDPEFLHWRLWLDALDEARRDSALAEVVEAAYLQWHGALVELIERIVEEGGGACADPQGGAWRLSALIDGLVGLLVFERTPLTSGAVAELLETQLANELRNGA
ncbi:MAG: TetR family transcriptional regulator C-terminal domain-containing protein [Pseudomonadota bacterium]